MGERNKSTEAIILSVHIQGENNRTVCALSPETGIFYCTLYGGPKSVLRSLVQPFNSGTIWLYENTARHSTKITDFDVKSCHLSFRTSLYKMWAANLASELIVKTKCAGENEKAFILFKALTDGMEATDENGARLGMLRFLWRYMGLSGLQPNVTQCVSCGENLIAPGKTDSGMALYNSSLHGFLCTDCMNARENKNLIVDKDALTYLAAINTLTPGKVRSLVLSSESAWRLKQFLYELTEEACGCRLNTLESGAGIL